MRGLTDEQEDLIYDIERLFDIEFYGDYTGGEFVQRDEEPFRRSLVDAIVDFCLSRRFSIGIVYVDDERIEFEFNNYHADYIGYGGAH